MTDLADRVCDCRPSPAALHAVTEDAQQLRLDFLHTLDDHGQISDSDGEEDEDDVDYDDYEEHECVLRRTR